MSEILFACLRCLKFTDRFRWAQKTLAACLNLNVHINTVKSYNTARRVHRVQDEIGVFQQEKAGGSRLHVMIEHTLCVAHVLYEIPNGKCPTRKHVAFPHLFRAPEPQIHLQQALNGSQMSLKRYSVDF